MVLNYSGPTQIAVENCVGQNGNSPGSNCMLLSHTSVIIGRTSPIAMDPIATFSVKKYSTFMALPPY